MTYQFDGYNYIIRFDRGEQLIEQLIAFVAEQGIAGGWVSAIGGVEWVELGYYQLDTHEYTWRQFDQVLEITSLQGTIAWVGDEPALHLHGSFSDEHMHGFGGHVRELQVGGTCELYIHLKQGQNRWSRSMDSSIGLKLLDLGSEGQS